MLRIVALTIAVFLFPVLGQAKDLEDLLVEKGVITKSEANAARIAKSSKVYWKNGTRLDFADVGFSSKINTVLQTRYQFTDEPSESYRENSSSFSLEHVRLIVSGTALHEEFSYKIEVDVVGDNDDDGDKGTELLDAYITWNSCDNAALTMGQFKVPVSRQWKTDVTKLQFADRSLVSDHFDYGYSQGADLQMNFMDERLLIGGSIVNGESDGEGINRIGNDTKHTGSITGRYNLMGKINPYEEGDIDYTEEAGLNAGLAYSYSEADNDVGLQMEETSMQTFNADLSFKKEGISLHSEFFWSDWEAEDLNAERENTGFYIQGGYFVQPKRLELAARYGYLDCDEGAASGECVGNESVNEVSASLNYYLWKHHLKAQLGYSFMNEDLLDAEASDLNTNKWLFQLSSYF